jgi:hypothetical protein
VVEKNIKRHERKQDMVRIRKHKLSKSVKIRQEKKKFKKEFIITGILAGVMILSVFGIMFGSFGSQSQKQTYNEFSFKSTNQGWLLDEDKEMYFDYLPDQLETVVVSEEVKNLFGAPIFTIVFNPNSESIEQIEKTRLKLAQHLMPEKAILYSITEENELYSLPLMTCENSTQEFPVILIQEANFTEISNQDSCIIINARPMEIQAAAERLVYSWLGIIK